MKERNKQMEKQHKKLVEMMEGNFAMQLALAPTVTSPKFKSLKEMSEAILAVSIQFDNRMDVIKSQRVDQLKKGTK